MAKTFPSQEQDRFIVRLPDGMRDRIAEAAKANNRSMNAEIVARLDSSFEAEATLLRRQIMRMRPDGNDWIDEETILEAVDRRLSEFKEILKSGWVRRTE